jgi:hypothetical protein
VIERLVELLRSSRAIVFLTGAGISTASGIPDFRGPGGLWTRRKPVYYEDFLASESARIEYWDYKLESWEIYRQAQPNAVHHAIAALERAGKVVAVLTQNVDGLHRRAGTSPERLVELHGTDLIVECQRCPRHQRSHPAFRDLQNHAAPADVCVRRHPQSRHDQFRPVAAPCRSRPRGRGRAQGGSDDCAGIDACRCIRRRRCRCSRPTGNAVCDRQSWATDHDGHASVTLRLDGDVTEIVPPRSGRALYKSEV